MKFFLLFITFFIITSFQNESKGKVLNTDEEIVQLLDYYSDTNNVIKDFGRDFKMNLSGSNARTVSGCIMTRIYSLEYQHGGIFFEYSDRRYDGNRKKSIQIHFNEKSNWTIKGLSPNKSKFKDVTLDSLIYKVTEDMDSKFQVQFKSKLINFESKKLSKIRGEKIDNLIFENRVEDFLDKVKKIKINKIILKKSIEQ